MRVLLDPVGDVAVHHDLVELVASRPYVVHEDLVRRQLVLYGGAAVADLLQLHAVPQLTYHLHPQPRLHTQHNNRSAVSLLPVKNGNSLQLI